MSRSRKRHHHPPPRPAPARKTVPGRVQLIILLAVMCGGVALFIVTRPTDPASPRAPRLSRESSPAPLIIAGWTERALAVSARFHQVYTPCWEGAYGAIGDAYLFALTGDSSLFRFHMQQHDLRAMCDGTWVDDEAWVCLAELKWWEMTGKKNADLVFDAVRRYREVREQGRLSHHEGFWAWYNWPPGSNVNERIFTNSNMNQMATVACGLYAATGDRRYLNDALLVWNGDGKIPGILKQWYRGKGVWRGRGGLAAFGKELPWGGLGCVPLAAALWTATRERSYRDVAIATTRRILDLSTGWVDSSCCYQVRMDGNGAFVNFLFDAYAVAPAELAEVPQKVERMLEHVWSNHEGRATVMLHNAADHGIRNGWNPEGGEDGYRVGEVGTVHAQGEAARAFGVFAYYHSLNAKNTAPRIQRNATR